MENENMNALPNDEEINSATLCGECEEIAVCNCENAEKVTLYQTEDRDHEQTHTCDRKDRFARKCREITDACRSAADRIAKDFQKANGNPYVKQTTVCRVEVYRSPNDETPIDTFYTEKVKGYSMRTLAFLGTAAFVIMCTAECVMKKILK